MAHEHQPIQHEREFVGAGSAAAKERAERAAVAAKETAAAYARVFTSPDGERVLADLRQKFGHQRPRFTEATKRSPIAAAGIDGQCDVLREIEAAMAAGGA